MLKIFHYNLIKEFYFQNSRQSLQHIVEMPQHMQQCLIKTMLHIIIPSHPHENLCK